MSVIEPTLIIPDPPRRRLTVASFLGLAEDGVDRMLLDGEVWEVGLMIKSPLHGKTAATLVCCLQNWLDGQPIPCGSLYVGNTGFRLDEQSVVGVDIAYASPALKARTPPDVEIFEEPPTLAVEILAPGDRHGPLVARVRKYLAVGTVVWEVDPDSQHVRVHRPGMPVESFNVTQELVGDPDLPGFRVAVAALFADGCAGNPAGEPRLTDSPRPGPMPPIPAPASSCSGSSGPGHALGMTA